MTLSPPVFKNGAQEAFIFQTVK